MSVLKFPHHPIYVPPPCDCSDYSESDTLEWSDYGREPMGWGGVAFILSAIVGPFVVIYGLWRLL